MPLFGPVHLSLLLTIAGAAAGFSWLSRERRLLASAVRLALGCGIAANELVW